MNTLIYCWQNTACLFCFCCVHPIIFNYTCVCPSQVPGLSAFLWTQTLGSCVHHPPSATQSEPSTCLRWQRLTEGCLLAAPPAPSPFRSDIHWNLASTNTLTAHLFNIKEWPRWGFMSLGPKTSCRHISLTSDKLPSHLLPIFPLWVFKWENFYLKWKSGSESNTPSWLVMGASCSLHWSRS